MPRPNRSREVFAEDHLAARIAAERLARDWTYDGLAKRMTAAGCPMTGSAIFKIEKSKPRRRIVVDELVAFSEVFSLSFDDLMLPPTVTATQEFQHLVMVYEDARRKAAPFIAAEWDAAKKMTDYAHNLRPDLALGVERTGFLSTTGHPKLTAEMADALRLAISEAED